MTTVIFSPWWTVPPAHRGRGDRARRAAQRFLPEPPRPAAVRDDGATQFRQPPGPGNPMGDVKFLLPNPFNVYLHDTPQDARLRAPPAAT